jgi:hypothetical protein
MTSDILLAFKRFLDDHDGDTSKIKCVLHTTPVDNNGTDLPKVIDHLMPEYTNNFIFSVEKLPAEHLNVLYNIADTTIHISSNEGFGLATAESIAAGTPIIVNVTGGLQDQCGFKWKNGEYFSADDYVDIGSLHEWRTWKGQVDHGEWVTPVWPAAINIQGSPPTPYIFDDRADIIDVKGAIEEQYEMGRNERKRRGLKGRKWLLGPGGLGKDHMCSLFKEYMTREIETWTPRKRFEVTPV